jgi:hypothetical protein
MHTHTCSSCGEKFQCNAPMVRNDDGWPDPVCILVVEEGPQRCDDCHSAQGEAQDERRREA